MHKFSKVVFKIKYLYTVSVVFITLHQKRGTTCYSIFNFWINVRIYSKNNNQNAV